MSLFYLVARLQVVPAFPPGDRRESSVEKAETADERARENWGEDKKARGEREEGENGREKRGLQPTHCSKVCASVGGLSILIGQFWLFRQQVTS